MVRKSEQAYRSTNTSHIPPGAVSLELVSGSVGGRAGRSRRRWCLDCLCLHVPEYGRRRVAGAKGNTTKRRLAGLAAGNERCTAWRRGTQGRPVVISPTQRANSARLNLRIVTRQQRRRHPSRPLWRTGHQGRVKVFQYAFPQARRGRDRTGWVPSGQARLQERGA